ncbi:hypothetical protein [Vibrio scophthalmi]|nr:hypothetical protein [Vibrio scophthalmi]
MDSWPDKDNPSEMITGMALTASLITIMPQRVQSVILKERSQQYQPAQPEQEF